MRQVTARRRAAQPLAPCDLLDLLCEDAQRRCFAWPPPLTWASLGRADGWGRADQGA